MDNLISNAKYLRDLTGDWREPLENMIAGDDDFTVGDWRYIRDDLLVDTLVSELDGDHYHLGGFSANFIADVTDLPEAMIECCQQAGQYAVVGEAIVDGGWLHKLAERAIAIDGAGHFFNSHDGNEYNVANYSIFHI